ncbi:MAG: protein-tyrosine phosphatase [Planctomycetota bacterium]|jgi:protein-tyrosine phosphatase
MKNVFYLRFQVVGRSGPNQDPWNAFDLSMGGIDAILSVNDGILVHPEDLASVDIDYACIPLSENAPPRLGDMEHCINTLPRALQYLKANIAAGKTTLVHCTSGKDRTGLLMAYYLCQCENMSPVEAITEVKRVRSIALTAPGWDDFALLILNRLSAENAA